MNVIIQIFYKSAGNSVYRKGNFPLKGKKPEEVAFQFWKEIKKESPFECSLDKVVLDVNEEITEKVFALEKTERLKRHYIAEDYLPF